MTDACAAILVGGRARRLDGVFKPDLCVGEQTILERQLDVLRAAGIDEVLAIGGVGRAIPRGVRVVADVVPDGGPLGGIYTGLLVSTNTAVVVLAGDLPFVSPALITGLATLGDDDEAVVPHAADRWHPLCAGYRRTVALRLKARLDRGARRVSDALADMHVRRLAGTQLAEMDPAGMLLMNVNTPDDHAHADRYARSIS